MFRSREFLRHKEHIPDIHADGPLQFRHLVIVGGHALVGHVEDDPDLFASGIQCWRPRVTSGHTGGVQKTGGDIYELFIGIPSIILGFAKLLYLFGNMEGELSCVFFHDSAQSRLGLVVNRILGTVPFDESIGETYGRVGIWRNSPLFFDFCYVPVQVTSDNLLILSSGRHGIEGYTGSAVQLMVMEEILNPDHLDTTGIFLIHGMSDFSFVMDDIVKEHEFSSRAQPENDDPDHDHNE